MFVNFFKSKMRKPVHPNDDIHKDEISTKYDTIVFGKEEEKLEYKLANCCNPIPGDNVFGFITINEGIKVHKKSCPNALSLQSNYAYRILPAKWIDSSQEEFIALIQLTGIDHLGLVSDVTKIISDNMHVNMKSISFDTDDGIFSGKITLIVKNRAMLKKLIENLKKLNGIDKVIRM